MKTLVVASGKGGVGKTTIAINLALGLSQHGRQVILIDGNFEFPNVGLMLGKSNFEETLIAALEGKKEIAEIVYKHHSGLRIIPGSISLEHIHKKDLNKFIKLIGDLKEYAELVIVDVGTGLHTDTLHIVKEATEIMLVTTPDFVSVTETLRTIKAIRQQEHHGTILGIVVNQYTGHDHDMSIENIQTLLGEKVIGTIPYHHSVKEALKLKYPVLFSHPTSAASSAFDKLACNLIGVPYEQKQPKRSKVEDTIDKLGLRKWYDSLVKEVDD